MKNEKEILEIISASGDSRSCSMEALGEFQKGNFDNGKKLLKQAQEQLLAAHKAHTVLLVQEANNETVEFSMLLLHSESHLNMAEVTMEYVKAIGKIYERGENI